MVSVEAQAADDVRRLVRIASIDRPKTPRQPDEKSPHKRAPLVAGRWLLSNANGGKRGPSLSGSESWRAPGSPVIDPGLALTTKGSVGRLSTRSQPWPIVSPAGQCLLEHARLIVQQVERMRGDLGSFARGLAGSVRLLSNTAALSEYLPRVLAGFLTANPTISLDVEERESADIAAALGSGAADVGIASVAVLPDTIEQFPFRDDVLVLVSLRVGKRREGVHSPWPMWSIALSSA